MDDLLVLLFSVSWNTIHHPSSTLTTIFSIDCLAKARWMRFPVKPISTCFLIRSTNCCWLKRSIFSTQRLSTLPSSRSYLKITLGKDFISCKAWERQKTPNQYIFSVKGNFFSCSYLWGADSLLLPSNTLQALNSLLDSCSFWNWQLEDRTSSAVLAVDPFF